ncbi:MAG: PEP-utilizing enzyme [Halobacteriales archaeon]
MPTESGTDHPPDLGYCPKCGAQSPFQDHETVAAMVRCTECEDQFFREGLRTQAIMMKATASELTGTPLAPGAVRAPVTRITEAEARAGNFHLYGDEIIVTDWFGGQLTWIDHCGGIVSTTGGLASPAATFSRELGVPAIGKCSQALYRLQEGQIAELYAEEGRLRFLNCEFDQDRVTSGGVFER